MLIDYWLIVELSEHIAHEWWGYWDCIYPSLVYVSLKEFGVVGLDTCTWGIKDFHKCWSLAKRRLPWAHQCNKLHFTICIVLLSEFVSQNAWLQQVQSLSHVRLFATPWIAARQASLSTTNSRSLPKLMSTESMIPSNNLILCHPLLLLPSSFSSIRVFSNKSTLHIRWPKYWSFSFSISPSNEYSGLISFRMDWLNLLAVQGTLTSLLQHHSSKASILRCTAFFIVELSHPYWENHSLD